MPEDKVVLIDELAAQARVISQPLQFKAQLGISDDAYASLTTSRALVELFQVGTAAAAGGAAMGSTAVASSFWGSWLTAIGIGTAVTPVGWVLGGAALAGALSWGALRALRMYQDSRVDVVPKFINTPVDLLGAALFDLVAGVGLIVLRTSGEIDHDERKAISDYFIEKWGFDPSYVDAALALLEETTRGKSVSEAATVLAHYCLENTDCNYEIITDGLMEYLTEIAEADGVVSPEEEQAIAEVHRIFEHEGRSSLARATEALVDVISEAPGAIRDFATSWFPQTDAGPEEDAPPEHEDVSIVPVPTLWLLGKTGSGKSSLVQAITGGSSAEVGNGFEPCTRDSEIYDYPSDIPIMRFIDTRGLGEIAYDPKADLALLQDAANMTLVVMRLDDPVQGGIADVIREIRRHDAKLPLIVVHTAPDQAENQAELNRALSANQNLIEAAWGATVPSVVLDLSRPEQADLTTLEAALMEVLPSVVMYLHQDTIRSAEDLEFTRNRTLVLSYAGGATAGGGLPLVGMVSVPSLQVAMLAALAGRYGVDWDRKRLLQLGAALGTGVVGGQALSFVSRELSKLIPVYGQTVAPVVGAGLGFASTWALGRTAAWWFYQLREGNKVDEEELRARFAAALKGADRAPG